MTSKMTYTLPDGIKEQAEVKSEFTVTQLEEGPLDATLFEIPLAFKRVERLDRNPSPSEPSVQAANFWERFKAGVARLFSQ